ncbi:MAG: hypothetical protein EZS28_053848, partial [Streblomastix strix]
MSFSPPLGLDSLLLQRILVRRTGILNLCPNVTLFTWLELIKEHFHQEITTLSSLFWTEQQKPMSIAKISELFTLLIKKIGIEGFTTYSLKHASTSKLAEMGIQERDLKMFTNHAPDSKSARNYYVFAANRQINGIAERLVTIDQAQRIKILLQRIMLSLFVTSFLPLSHPGFLPNPSSELKVQSSNANTTTNP